MTCLSSMWVPQCQDRSRRSQLGRVKPKPNLQRRLHTDTVSLPSPYIQPLEMFVLSDQPRPKAKGQRQRGQGNLPRSQGVRSPVITAGQQHLFCDCKIAENQIKSNSHQRRHPSQYCAQSGLCMGFAAWRQMLTNHDHHRRFSSLFVVPRMGCTYTNRNRLRLTLCLNQFSHVRRLNLQLQQQMGRRSLLHIQSSLIVWLSKFLSGSPYED